MLLVLIFLMASNASAQRDRQADRTAESEYSTRFFDQLETLFGRFRDADLDRAFEAAAPIQCSELVSGDGKWRNVAFFNEDRRLGAWYHRSLEEVKGDLSEYIFTGECTTEESSVQLVTKFPVLESIERYKSGRIHFNEIRVKTNPAVRTSFSSRSQIYTFELPYLYANLKRNTKETVYSLIPDRADDRFATNVTNHWECKAVRARDVTFQFLICQTWTLPRDTAGRRQTKLSFGSYAYFILSDGKEASTSVKLSFGTGEEANPPSPTSRPPVLPDQPADPPAVIAATDAGPFGGWQIPNSSSRLVDANEGEFRVVFNQEAWANKITSSQVLVDKKMSILDPAKIPTTTDYCVWRPASVNLVPRVLGKEPDKDVAYTLTATDGTRQSPASLAVDMKTYTGSRLGTLQCFFARTESVAEVSVSRWTAVVGTQLAIETRP